MDYTNWLQEINACGGMCQLRDGELVVVERIKGKHIMYATQLKGANPNLDFTLLLIHLTTTIDGFRPTMDALLEMDAVDFMPILELVGLQLNGGGKL